MSFEILTFLFGAYQPLVRHHAWICVAVCTSTWSWNSWEAFRSLWIWIRHVYDRLEWNVVCTVKKKLTAIYLSNLSTLSWLNSQSSLRSYPAVILEYLQNFKPVFISVHAKLEIESRMLVCIRQRWEKVRHEPSGLYVEAILP